MGGSRAPKFYGVRAGHRPGVYLTWPECEKQVKGFKAAQYKSFLSRQDASDYVAGKSVADRAAAKPKGSRYYGVAEGRKIGVYSEWSEVLEVITGCTRPAYKRFPTWEEADQWVKNHKKRESGKKRELSGAAKHNTEYEKDDEREEDDSNDSDDDENHVPPAAKRRRVAADVDTRSDAAPGSVGAVLEIYTDGSSRGNGQTGARAGVGVWFGHNDDRNLSERLPGDPQTNQRAELTAVLRALQTARYAGPIRIISDSRYSIQCVTEWAANWSRNGWVTRGGPVKNKDLVVAILAARKELEAKGGSLEFRWVKGHGTNTGNVGADALAVAGAEKPMPNTDPVSHWFNAD